MLKLLDRYIIFKYLKTFFFTVLIFSLIAIAMDFSDKVEEFIEASAPLDEIVFNYYFNWTLWINSLLFPMYAMIAVIFFTSRMAANSEVISIFNAGVSFRRILRAYLLGAFVIFLLHLLGNHLFIPKGNQIHYDFQFKYVLTNPEEGQKENVHRFIGPGEKVYVNYFQKRDSTARDLRIEKFENNELVYLLKAKSAEWQEPPNHWLLRHYEIRTFDGDRETRRQGRQLDTTFNLTPGDFVEYTNQKEMMTTPDLLDYIESEKFRGGANTRNYEVELHRRTAEPFTILIVTIIGMAVASRKVRGGVGLHLVIGIALGAVYIFLSKFSVTFSINQTLPAFLGVWIPNVIFLFVAITLAAVAQK